MTDLSSFLAGWKDRLELPAVAAAVVHGPNIVAAGAFGDRKFGSEARVAIGDKFHIGSCTKSITALLAALMVRDEVISFDTTVASIFPDWKLDADKGSITLEWLLQNRSGIGNDPDPALWKRAFQGLDGDPPAQRKEFLQEILKQPLSSAPGTHFIYSNLGFSLAGVMLESRANQPWETLVRERIFEPLQLRSAGFRAPAAGGDLDQPWGHQRVKGVVVPMPPGDNPVAIAPAGAVHMSILDVARYAAFHLALFNGKIPDFKRYRSRLYEPPPGESYSLGWFVSKRDWAGGTILNHAGSNTMFYCVIWIAPEKDCAFVVATNIGDSKGNVTAGKCDEVVAALIKKFVP